ncbi:MBOAT family O-acyltransferase [Paraburkholderia sp. EG285A]|uniref:MBOAT family O-acyltransferase n=1 Tax=Paraburkholderia sp. EG285A TaxID=3237009 RepID=UPI0034D29613
MELTSWQFAVFSIAAIFVYNASRNARWRAGVLSLANVVFIASHLHAPLQALALVAMLTLGYVSTLVARRWNSTPVVSVCIAFVVIAFLYLKRYAFVSFLPTLPFAYLLLGLSYILFRIIHLIVDTASGDIEQRVTVWDYFNYTCNFLTFISGPIQRFQNWRDDANPSRALEAADVDEGMRRVIWGYFKILAVSAMANAVFLKLSPALIEPGAHPVASAAAARYLVTAAVYTVFLFYNFSGFIDVVIGFGRFFGMRLPENFNRPFVAANFLDFWGRWHMTLSNWFRDYMFNPLLRTLMGRFENPKLAPAFGVSGFFVTFAVMGIWHGSTTVFIAYGLVMGLGASVNKLYQLFMAARLGRKRYRALCSAPAYVYLCRGLTFAYFTMGVTALWVDFGQFAQLGRELGVIGTLAAYAGLTALGACAFAVADLLQAGFRRVLPAARVAGSRPLAAAFALAAVLLLALATNALFSQPPEFVYRAF